MDSIGKCRLFELSRVSGFAGREILPGDSVMNDLTGACGLVISVEGRFARVLWTAGDVEATMARSA